MLHTCVAHNAKLPRTLFAANRESASIVYIAKLSAANCLAWLHRLHLPGPTGDYCSVNMCIRLLLLLLLLYHNTPCFAQQAVLPTMSAATACHAGQQPMTRSLRTRMRVASQLCFCMEAAHSQGAFAKVWRRLWQA